MVETYDDIPDPRKSNEFPMQISLPGFQIRMRQPLEEFAKEGIRYRIPCEMYGNRESDRGTILLPAGVDPVEFSQKLSSSLNNKEFANLEVLRAGIKEACKTILKTDAPDIGWAPLDRTPHINSR